MSFIEIINHGIIFKDGIIIANTADIVKMAIAALACIVIPYLLGSINFAIIISGKQYHQDIRSYGSKNAGMTNMMRTYGKRAAGLTLLGDAVKAMVAGIFGYLLLGYLGAFIAGLFCVVGHMFPVFFKFRGGKGVVTAAVAILMCDPITFLILLLMFLIIVLWTKYISLGSVMCVLLYPIILDRVYKWIHHATCPYIIFAVLITVLIVAKHYENIKRLMSGTESKFSFKKSKTAEEVTLPEPEDIETEAKEISAPAKATKKKKINKNYGKKKK